MKALIFASITCLLAASAHAQYGGGAGDPNDPYLIYTPEQMNAIGASPGDWDKHFKLMADIDLGGYTGEQFNVIGRDFPQIPPFSGSFDGNGHRILNFTYRSSRTDSVGLFGYVSTALHFGGPPAVKDLGLVDPNVEAPNARGVAALVGQVFNGTISGCYVEGGRVSGGNSVGGLVGYTSETNMATERRMVDCRVSCQVSGVESVGGLAGGLSAMACVLRCQSSGTVTGGQYVGGLLSVSDFAQISDCYSTSHVIGENKTGGLLGRSQGDTITACAALGCVDGQSNAGGLVGSCMATVVNCYAVAPVSGTSRVGGLVGVNQGTISTSYAAGPVTGESDVGGLIGAIDTEPFYPASSVSDSFWDVEASGQTTSADGTGKTTAEMQTGATFLEAGWDFVGETANGTDDIWRIDEGQGYPRLWWEPRKYRGGTGEPNDPYRIATAGDLIMLGENPQDYDKYFILIADVDLDPNLPGRRVFDAAVIAPDADANDFPAELQGTPFSGVFDGNGHAIRHLTIQGVSHVGLFGKIAPEGCVSHLGVEAVDVNGIDYNVGGLAGCNEGTIIDCYSTGKVDGDWSAGGLVGCNNGSITEAHNAAAVDGDTRVGGLVGYQLGSITASYNAGAVHGSNGTGGLAGQNRGSIMASRNVGPISGYFRTGGLAGANWSGSIRTSYNLAAVTGNDCIGGLLGENWWESSVRTSYSTGPVGGETRIGGFIGQNYGSIAASFWDVETSGQTNPCGCDNAGGCDGAFGKTTAEMQTATTFLEAGWDFVDEAGNGTDDIWWIDEGQGYPRLWWELGE